MKKIVILILLIFVSKGFAQLSEKNMFSKDPIINLETEQKQRLSFGFYLGLNNYNFKINYKTVAPDIQIEKTTGFNIGIVADLRLQEYINLRFEPGFYYARRDLYYPNPEFKSKTDYLRNVDANYINFPLLLKFSSLRTGNVRPYLVGGMSTSLNLSSDSESIEDNMQQRFRVKTWTMNYEIGFGIDFFTEYFIFSPSVRGSFGINDELIRDKDPNSPWTGNIESLKTRAILINFSFH